MSEKKVTVTVNEGRVRGIKKKSTFSGAEYYSFFGVPYGQSTAGMARFKDPIKVKPWKNILDASNEEKEGCFQYAIVLSRFAGSKDCLYNNIHTPNIPAKGDSLKPVVVNIHPGALFHGSPETWYYGSPEYVMHRDIVSVSVAYRLHLLGYQILGLEDCSGNQALKDIILSLQWLKENISAFGGDPNNITLLGSSSGSFLVHFLMLSPVAKGLFHKAMLMGIHAFNETLTMQTEHKEEAYECAAMLGYPKTEGNDAKKLLSYLKKSPLTTFVSIRTELMGNQRKALLFPSSFYSPTVDIGENAVLPKSPEKLIEFLLCMACVKKKQRWVLHGTTESFYKSYRQNSWGWGRDITDDDVKLIKEQVDDFYFKGASFETAPLSLKVDVQTDASFSSVYNTLIDVIAKDLPSSVFVYKFQFDGNTCNMKDRILPLLEESLEGSHHASDYSYWACIKDHWGVRTPTLTPKSREIVETFTQLISTFARTGNPNYESLQVEWKPSTPEKPCYLNTNETLDVVEGKLNGERIKFWENIQKKLKKV